MSKIRKTAEDFFNRYRIANLKSSDLKRIIRSQGYTIVEFNNISNSAEINMLIDTLNLRNYASNCKAFTYADNSMRLLFIAEGLSEEESLILLAHEEGHIFCGHLQNSTNTYGQDIIKEREANEFSHYILSKNFFRSLKLSFLNNKAKYLLSVLAVFFITAFFVFAVHNTNILNNNQNQYVITENGAKYHRPDCIVIKYSKNKNYVTADEIKTLYPERKSCKVCLPDKIE